MRDIRYQIAIDKKPDNALSEETAEIEVQQTIEGPTNFRIKFAIDICDGEMSLLDDARLNPGNPDREVSVIAYLNGASHVLAHGIITERKVSLAEGGAGSSLELLCQDRRLVLARSKSFATHAGRASDIVKQILEENGFDADVTDTEITYEEDGAALNQTETNLAFIDKLAGRNDTRFWIDREASVGFTGFDITETAHFKPSPPRPADNPLGFSPPIQLAPPADAVLILNAGDGCSNVSSFELQSTAETPNRSGTIIRIDPDSGEPAETEAPEATTDPLGDAATAPSQPRIQQLVTAGDAQEARVRTQAALNDASWAVQAVAETSVQALNAFVAPHQTVRVTGAGTLNSGTYFVKSVAHTVDASAHKMRIELLRNALGRS